VPLKEEPIVIPDVQLISEEAPLTTSAMIGSLVRHFVDASNDETTSTNTRNSNCIVDCLATGRISIHLWLPVVCATGCGTLASASIVVGRQRSRPFWWMATGDSCPTTREVRTLLLK
jgi:hypothetical protein